MVGSFLSQNRPFNASRNRPFPETNCSVFPKAYPTASARTRFLLTNLKTHLIIRISKGRAVNGKRETKRKSL